MHVHTGPFVFSSCVALASLILISLFCAVAAESEYASGGGDDDRGGNADAAAPNHAYFVEPDEAGTQPPTKADTAHLATTCSATHRLESSCDSDVHCEWLSEATGGVCAPKCAGLPRASCMQHSAFCFFAAGRCVRQCALRSAGGSPADCAGPDLSEPECLWDTIQQLCIAPCSRAPSIEACLSNSLCDVARTLDSVSLPWRGANDSGYACVHACSAHRSVQQCATTSDCAWTPLHPGASRHTCTTPSARCSSHSVATTCRRARGCAYLHTERRCVADCSTFEAPACALVRHCVVLSVKGEASPTCALRCEDRRGGEDCESGSPSLCVTDDSGLCELAEHCERRQIQRAACGSASDACNLDARTKRECRDSCRRRHGTAAACISDAACLWDSHWAVCAQAP